MLMRTRESGSIAWNHIVVKMRMRMTVEILSGYF